MKRESIARPAVIQEEDPVPDQPCRSSITACPLATWPDIWLACFDRLHTIRLVYEPTGANKPCRQLLSWRRVLRVYVWGRHVCTRESMPG